MTSSGRKLGRRILGAEIRPQPAVAPRPPKRSPPEVEVAVRRIRLHGDPTLIFDAAVRTVGECLCGASDRRLRYAPTVRAIAWLGLHDSSAVADR
jgi:hypothetical protein